MNKKTLILDADMGLANIDVILGLAPKYNLSHVLSGEKTLADVILEGPGGMHILPASSGIRRWRSSRRGRSWPCSMSWGGLAGTLTSCSSTRRRASPAMSSTST